MPDDVRPLLVFFYSPRSGPARRMESLLAHLARKERDRLRVKRVDVDAHPQLAERFRVNVVPSVVLVKDKRVVDRIDGRASAPRIERMLAPHLTGDLAPGLVPERLRRLEQLDDAEPEPGCTCAVDDPVVEGHGDVRHPVRDKPFAVEDGALGDAVQAEDGDLGLVDERRRDDARRDGPRS